MANSQATVAIVTDSIASLPPALVQAYDLEVVPLVLAWDGETYLDGVDITPQAFYRLFKERDTKPSTSVPTPAAFAEAYARAAARADGIVGVFASRMLTSIVSVATLAAEVAPVPVRIVDTRCAAMAEGFCVLEAARRAQQGGTLDEVAGAAEDCRGRSGLVGAFQTLEHLIRLGRGKAVARMVTSRLHVEPVVTIANGSVVPVAVARNHAHSADCMVRAVQRVVGERPFRASVFHADQPEDGEALAERMRAMPNCIEFVMSHLTPVMGAHTGPALLGIAWSVAEDA